MSARAHPGCTIARMRNAMLTSLMLSLACHMGDVIVTTGGQDVGEEGPPPDESTTTSSGTDGTTGLGHSESGPPMDSSTSGSGTTTSPTSSGSSGESTSSAGSTTDYTTTGQPCAPTIVMLVDGPRCMCGDEPVDPIECGCTQDAEGYCDCEGAIDLPTFVCGWPCAPSGPDPCLCGNRVAPVSFCDM